MTSGTNSPNEPYTLSNAASKSLVQKAMLDRLRIARYMYTELFKVTKNGGALVKPMFFSNPSDADALKNIEQDFMVGEYVKVSPLLAKENKDKYSSYFPASTGNEKWVNIFNPEQLISTQPDTNNAEPEAATVNQFVDL